MKIISFITITYILLLSFGCTNEKKEVELYILPEREAEINSLLSSEEDGKHIHIENYVPEKGGEKHLIYCKSCGQALGEAEHQPKTKIDSIAYRGTKRYHVKRCYCSCGLFYAEEFFACLSDDINCRCFEPGVRQ
jgi:hypothetical protein